MLWYRHSNGVWRAGTNSIKRRATVIVLLIKNKKKVFQALPEQVGITIVYSM